MELARQLTWSRQRAELFHYRTKDKVEVNAVLENRRGEMVGIEVKASSTVGPDDFRGLRHLAARTGDGLHRRRGAVHRHPDAAVRAQDARDADRRLVGNLVTPVITWPVVRVEEVQALRVDGEGDALLAVSCRSVPRSCGGGPDDLWLLPVGHRGLDDGERPGWQPDGHRPYLGSSDPFVQLRCLHVGQRAGVAGAGRRDGPDLGGPGEGEIAQQHVVQ